MQPGGSGIPQGNMGAGPAGGQGGPGLMSPGFPMPMGAFGMNDATAQFGMQLGQSAVAAGQEYVQKNVRLLLPSSNDHAEGVM